jgi:anti-sigma B factor antagonist
VLLRLLRAGSGPVMTIDLSKVSYMDVSGIATLMEALKIASELALKLRLIGMSGQVRMLAEVTELDRILRAVGSEVVLS